MSQDSYLVIGGCGFLGRHIVEQLLARGEKSVAVFDLVQRHFDPEVQFHTGDITDERQVSDAIRKSNITCIIHTASPVHGLSRELYLRVNVEGTKTIIAAAQANGVRKLVFTSSASVVMAPGQDIIDVDERMPYPETYFDDYTESKALAEEAVLEANGKGGLLTCALRPAGIFGPGDRQAMVGFANVYERGQTRFQIGDNTNLFDWTYVGNVAKAHILAADKLTADPPLTQDTLDDSLPPIELTTGSHRIPTSSSRPLGPALTPVPNADQIAQSFTLPKTTEQRPVLRTRFDPLSKTALERETTSPLQVAGQAFFITNGEPLYFWDFARSIWRELGLVETQSRIVIPKGLGWYLAKAAECWGWVSGREVQFSTSRVGFSCTTRWYNIEKARRVLGYEPDVGVEEGVKRTVKWYLDNKTKTKETTISEKKTN